mgnify:CR=1 FL=1
MQAKIARNTPYLTLNRVSFASNMQAFRRRIGYEDLHRQQRLQGVLVRYPQVQEVLRVHWFADYGEVFWYGLSTFRQIGKGEDQQTGASVQAV